jgi:CRISPR-associated endoribonuclease Cas2 subtype I-E
MLGIAEGVCVARLSARVRERLWQRVCADARPRTVALPVYACDTNHGYAANLEGRPERSLVDFDGLALVRIPE